MTSSLTTPAPARAFKRNALTDAQKSVLRAFHEFGKPMDDVALVAYVNFIEMDPQSESSIRSRRAELGRTSRPLLRVAGVTRRPGKRPKVQHALTAEGKRVAAKQFS